MNASIAKKMGLLDTGSSPGTYSSLAEIKNDFDRRKETLENSWDLPEKAKNLRMAQLKTELTEQWHKTKQALERKADAELKAVWQKANPKPNVSDMSPGQLQARQEVLEDITGIVNRTGDDPNSPDVVKSGRGNAILDLYARYAAQEYEIGMEAVVQRGRQYLTADQAKELQAMEDYRKPALAEARRSLEQLRQSQSNEGTAQALMENGFMKATALTSGESQALHQATELQRVQQRMQQNEGTQ